MARMYVSTMTRAALDARRASNLLRQDRIYIISDENRFAIATGSNSYTEMQDAFSSENVILNGDFAEAQNSWGPDFDGDGILPTFENGRCQLFSGETGYSLIYQEWTAPWPASRIRLKFDITSFEGDGYMVPNFGSGDEDESMRRSSVGTHQIIASVPAFQNMTFGAHNCAVELDNIELYVAGLGYVLLDYARLDSEANFQSRVSSGGAGFAVAGSQVVIGRIGGWGNPTGTVSRATFNADTVTTAQLAQRVAQLIRDLHANTSGHGLIGT